jgi:hypothetical protein
MPRQPVCASVGTIPVNAVSKSWGKAWRSWACGVVGLEFVLRYLALLLLSADSHLCSDNILAPMSSDLHGGDGRDSAFGIFPARESSLRVNHATRDATDRFRQAC